MLTHTVKYRLYGCPEREAPTIQAPPNIIIRVECITSVGILHAKRSNRSVDVLVLIADFLFN